MTQILLVSDIHANLHALEAVLSDAESRGQVDQVWSLGDTVGYGPRPNECLKRLRELGAFAVAGNHELAALGLIPVDSFNPNAAEAARWTASVLADDAREYASSLPETLIAGDFTLVHGSPRDPVWEYIIDSSVAEHSAPYLQTPNCANGHTHVPMTIAVAENTGAKTLQTRHEQVVGIGSGRWFVNPGSVGQPRDGDPRASYAVLDSGLNEIAFFRVEYPIEATQHQMEVAGLPDMLIRRLAFGK